MTTDEAFEKWWNSLIIPQSVEMQQRFEYAKGIAKKAFLAGAEAATNKIDKMPQRYWFDSGYAAGAEAQRKKAEPQA